VILLDTNVCIAAINRHPASVLERLRHAGARGTRTLVSTISIFELRFGIAKSSRVAANAESLDLFLAPIDILPFEEEDAKIAGNIRAALERVGRPIGPYDYLIAAQAIRHELTLISANEKEFSRVAGLQLENWTA
jgi:tRNA(fMet)-specific endonuclease VapC